MQGNKRKIEKIAQVDLIREIRVTLQMDKHVQIFSGKNVE